MPYQVVGKRHYRGWNQKFDVGSQIEPTEEELKSFPGRFEEVKRGPGRPRSAPNSEEELSNVSTE